MYLLLACLTRPESRLEGYLELVPESLFSVAADVNRLKHQGFRRVRADSRLRLWLRRGQMILRARRSAAKTARPRLRGFGTGSSYAFKMSSQPLRYAGRWMKGEASCAFVARRFR